MNWYAATVPPEHLAPLLDKIRNSGGTVAGSRPDVDGVHVTWTTVAPDPDNQPNSRPAGGR